MATPNAAPQANVCKTNPIVIPKARPIPRKRPLILPDRLFIQDKRMVRIDKDNKF